MYFLDHCELSDLAYTVQLRSCPKKDAKKLFTFALLSPPYGTFSSAPLNAPSVSPPRSSCFICPASDCTSEAETEGTEAGRRDDTGKLAGESGSRRSMFIVRQFDVAMLRSILAKELSEHCAFTGWPVQDIRRANKLVAPPRWSNLECNCIK